MKRLLLILLLYYAAHLGAQTTQLPDIEITGEAKIKLPMRIQKVELDTADVLPDSLPLLIPRSRRFDKPPTLEVTNRTAWFTAEFGSRLSTRLWASWYTGKKRIPFAKAGLSTYRFRRGWAQQDYNLYLSAMIGIEDITPELSYLHSTAPDHYTDSYQIIARNNTNRLDLGNWQFSGVSTAVSLEAIDSATEGVSQQHLNLGFSHSHALRFGDLRFYNVVMVAGGVPSFMVSTRISSLAWFTDIDLTLASDFVHLLPSLSFCYPVVNRNGTRVVISNSPAITGYARGEIARSYKWLVQPDRMRTGITPLDLGIVWKKQFPPIKAVPAKLRAHNGIEISVAHHLLFKYNSPILLDGGFTQIPLLGFTDQWENHTSANICMEVAGFKLGQSFNLDLVHISENSYRLKPYTPLIQATTSVSHSIGHWDLSLGLTQQYMSRDHLKRDLNNVAKLDLTGEYRITKYATIYARILDMFNTPSRIWNTIPGTGREAFLGIKYWMP